MCWFVGGRYLYMLIYAAEISKDNKLIKGHSLTDENFNVAKVDLDKKYLDTNKIIQSIVVSICNYKNLSPDNNYANILTGLTTLKK